MSDTGALPARLDAATIQRHLAIGPRHFYTMVAEGRFPPPDLRVGKNRRRLWNVNTIQEWEAQQHGARADVVGRPE